MIKAGSSDIPMKLHYQYYQDGVARKESTNKICGVMGELLDFPLAMFW